jgi:GntR family transcriptional regulator, arabinose operon transcriptional repressor
VNMMQRVNKKDEIYQQLKEKIMSGKYAPKSRFPKEIDFAKQFGVARVTLRSALGQLLSDGMIKRIPRKGTFVADDFKPVKPPTIMIVSNDSGGIELPHNYIFPEIIRLAQNKDWKTLTITDATLLMFSSVDIISYIKENNVIGIITVMNSFRGDEAILKKFRNSGVSVVIAHCVSEDTKVTGFAGIVIDEKEGWEAAVAYLSECGHKNISMLGYSKAREKFRGFTRQKCIELVKKHGATPMKSWITAVDFDKGIVKETIKKMFSGYKRPTAILCYSDFFAIYVYEALKEINLRIPEDVAVMGTCGYPDTKLLSPSLSTVDYEYSKFAALAVEMLQKPEKWFSGGKGKLRKKTFKIRKRESTKIKLIK